MITPQQHAQILANLGISALNPMQEAAQETILRDNDTFLIAPTGSAKPLAFSYPFSSCSSQIAQGYSALF